MQFPAQFKVVLEASNLTKNAMAQHLNTSRSYFSKVELGQKRISTDMLGRVLTLLDHQHAVKLLEAYLQDEASTIDAAYKAQLGKSKRGLAPSVQVNIAP